MCQTWVSEASGRDLGHSPSSAPDFLCDLQAPPSLGLISVICKMHTVFHEAQGPLPVPTRRPAWASTTRLPHQQGLRGGSFSQKFTSPGGWIPSASGVLRALLSRNSGRRWRYVLREREAARQECWPWGQPEGRRLYLRDTCACPAQAACLELLQRSTC